MIRVQINIKGKSASLNVPAQRNVGWLVEAALLWLQ